MSLIFKDYIKKCKHKNVSIGAADGSSYIYVGPFNFDGICEMDKIIENYHLKVKARHPSVKRAYHDFINNREYDMNTEEGLLAYGKKAGELYTSFAKSHNYIETFVPLLDRKVVNRFMRETEEDNETIILEGYEIGRFWSSLEYNEYKADLERKEIYDTTFKTNLNKIILIEEEEVYDKNLKAKKKKINKFVVIRDLMKLVEDTFEEGFSGYFKEKCIYKPGMKVTSKAALSIVKEMINKYHKRVLGGE